MRDRSVASSAYSIFSRCIRVVGARARITAQLVDTNSGSHLWAERYERDLNDIFSIQDEISRAVASMAVLRLEDDRLERVASKPPNSITAYEWWLRGKRALALSTREGMFEAQRLFEKALEIDPNYARGIAGLAFVHNLATSYTGWGVSLDEPHELALNLARKAAQLDPTDHVAEIILGWCYMFRRQYNKAKTHFDRAYALNPNDADGLAYRSNYLAYTAQCEEAMRSLTQAFRLNPYHPNWYLGYSVVAHVLCHHYDRAIEAGSQASSDVWPEFPGWLAVAHAHLGNLDEARSLGAAFLHNVRSIWRGTRTLTIKSCSAGSFSTIPSSTRQKSTMLSRDFGSPGLECERSPTRLQAYGFRAPQQYLEG